MKNRWAVTGLVIAIVSAFCVSGTASAYSYSTIEQKAIANGIRRCYSDTGSSVVLNSIGLKEFNNYESVILDNSSSFVPLPNGFSALHKIDNNNVSCRQLFGGYNYNAAINAIGNAISNDGHTTISLGGGSFSGLLRNANVSLSPTTEASKRSVLETLGYVADVQSTEGKCLSFNLSYSQPTNPNLPTSVKRTAQLCSDDGSASADHLDLNNTTTSGLNNFVTGPVVYSLRDGGVLQMSLINSDRSYTFKTYALSNYASFEALGDALRSDVNSHFGSCVTTSSLNGISDKYCPNNLGDGLVNYTDYGESASVTYSLDGSRISAAYKTANNLLGSNFKSAADLIFSPDEMFQLYNRYLIDYYGINAQDGVICNASETRDVMVNDRGYAEGPRLVDGKIRICYIKAMKNNDDNKKVYALNSQRYFGGEEKTWRQLLSDLMSVRDELTVAGMKGGEANADNTGINTGTDDKKPTTTDDGMAECKAGSGVVGWIVCPIVKAVYGIGSHMWEQIETYHLKIPAQQVFSDGSGVRTAWELVNNISNIAFVILFMVVIFSQLTGVGIDNYGIKRILPRLIIVAILANLSYFICELAVDLSNIAGVGLNDLLSGAAAGVGASSDSEGVLAAGLGLDILMGGSVATFYIALNPAGPLVAAASLGLALLGVVISVVVAMLTLYAILVIREAGIILAVVIAPIAIICYALPNTEKLYKRWFDVFKALLVVYPLCGLVVGAGQLAGAALGSINTESMKVAAILVQVIPFFLIPMLLKSSLAGLGNIGNKLSSMGRNIGRRASGFAQNGIRNSARFKDWEQYQRDKTAAARASKIQTRMKNKTDAGKTLSDRQKNLARKANEAVNAYTGQKMRDEIGATEDYFQAGQTHQAAAFQAEREKMFAENMKHESNRDEIHKTLKQALKEKDSAKAVAAMKELIARGGTKEALDTMEKADWQLMKDNGIEDRLVQGLGETDVDAFKAYSKYRGSGGTRGFSDWMQGKALGETVEYTDENGEKKRRAVKAASYGSHLAENGFQAMDNYSKDEAQFVQSHFDMIKSSMGENGKDLAGMVASMAAHSKDAKVKTVAEETIRAQLASGAMDIKSMGLTAEMLGSMRGATAEAMLGGLIDKKKLELEAKLRTDNPGMSEAQIKAQVEARNDDTRAAAELELRTQLGTQIKGIESDVRIRNKTAGGVLEVLGIGGNGQRTIEEVSTPVRGADAAGGTVVGGAAAAGAAGAAAQPIVVTPAGNATGLEEAYNRMGNNIAQAVREGAAAGAAQGAQQGTQQGAQQAAQNQQGAPAQGQAEQSTQGEGDINEARERFVDEVMEAVHRGQAERERAQQEGNNTPPANPNNNTSGE